MPEIRVLNLRKSFGTTTVLDGIGFTVHDKEFVTLLGPSGCGKTTTLMSIAGFQTPDEGVIAVGDEVFADRRAGIDLPAERRNLGIVFQSYALWPHMTVAQNVAFPLSLRKVDKRAARERVAEVLDLVELGAHGGRYPHQLSGGQQQRVALARAIAYSPKVLLLDEPFSNLDAKLRERARDWLKHLQLSLGLTTVFVTHDRDEALAMSDRVLVMNNGRVLRDGTAEEVYHEPRARFVAQFLGRCNFLTGRVESGPDGTSLLRTPANCLAPMRTASRRASWKPPSSATTTAIWCGSANTASRRTRRIESPAARRASAYHPAPRCSSTEPNPPGQPGDLDQPGETWCPHRQPPRPCGAR